MASSKLSRTRSSSADLKKNFERDGLELHGVSKTGKELGRGSYAKVFEVMLHGTYFAAKEVHKLIDSGKKIKEYFLDECFHTSKLRHPNIVQLVGIYYSNQTDELPWLVMELMPKGSLNSLIESCMREKKDIPWHYKLSILMNICQGLQFLHSQHIVHRDLSSNNVLLTKDYVAKIADLGVAKVIIPQHQQVLTQIPGTQVFMPPEAFLTEPKYGTSLDIFSLGCVCIHLVSLEFPKPEALQQLDETGKITVLSLTEFQRRKKYLENFKHLPALKDWTEQCLKDSPKDRPAIGEVVEGLKSIHKDPSPHENDDILQLYTLLIDCEIRLDEKGEEVASYKEEIREKDKELTEQSKKLNLELRNISQQLTEKHQQLVIKNQQLLNLESTLNKRNTELDDYKKALHEKERELAQCRQQITDNDKKLTKTYEEFNQQIAKITAEKDQQLAVAMHCYERKLNKKEQELAKCRQQIKDKDTKITEKFKQFNWKITQITAEKDQQFAVATHCYERKLNDKKQELAQCRQQITDKGKELTKICEQINWKLAKIKAQKGQQLAIETPFYEKTFNGKEQELAQCMRQTRGKDEELARFKNTLSEKEENKDQLEAAMTRVEGELGLTMEKVTALEEAQEAAKCLMEKCQCSFWRKPFPCLCCCKQVINSSANMTKACSCSFWRKLFCLCYCEQIIEESESESDPLFPQSVSKYVLKNVTELHSISCMKCDDKICSGKSYSPAAFVYRKLTGVNSYKLVMKKCEREVKILSEGLNGQNIIKFIGIYFIPNSSLPILVTEKIDFSLLQHIETSQDQCLQIAESYGLLYDICKGLSYLHSVKVVHLNLSTKSVLLTDKLIPKISNFEYATYKNPVSLSEDDLLLMRSRDDLFTFNFLPPHFFELLEENNHHKGTQINESIDVYSFGCVMLNMFTQWPSSPHANELKVPSESSPEECQNHWLSLIAKSDTAISDIAKFCLDSNPAALQRKTKTLLEKLKRCSKAKVENAALVTKAVNDGSQFANKAEATTLQPKQISGKSVMLVDSTAKQLKINNVTAKNHKKINAGSTKEQTKPTNIALQTNKITMEDGFLQTKEVKLQSTTSQTEKEPSNKEIKSRFKILKDQLQISIAKNKLLLEDYNKLEKELVSLRETLQDKNKELENLQISVAENKLLLEDYNKLEKELMSLRKILQDKNTELEKYYTKCIEAEEESFKFTNAFPTAGEGSVMHLRTVYRHMQHNVRSAAVLAHKKVFPNIPLHFSDHGMVAYKKAKSIVFQAFSDILNDQLFQMKMPHSQPIQPQQDDTLKQCMKLLACFHTSLKHAEGDVKQSLLQEYEGLTKHTFGCIPEDVEKYYTMLAKFTWDCVARTIPMIMSTDETTFNTEMHELKDEEEKEKQNILYVYPILFTSNRWPREVAVKGKVKY